jgi:xanthine/CO dehydrogenase XdhC/CoxF family maturation factor
MALATNVRTHGSSYRGIGTRMLIMENGETVGALSAGCLEGDIAQKARQVIASGVPLLLSYDTRRLFGCDGAIDVLIERVEPENAWFDFLAQCLERRRCGVSLAIFEGADERTRGSYPLLLGDEWCEAAPAHWREQFESEARNALATEQSRTVTIHEPNALLHVVQPPVHLIVAGAAYDAVPLWRQAQALGWPVTILARPEDDPFPFDGAEVLPVTAPDEWPLAADARTAGVIMTHHFGRDFAFLRQMLHLPFGYLGLLGPRGRRERLVAALEEQSDFAGLTKLHNPAGLDLGAETPEEIALAITAEIQAVMNGARAGFLRERKGPIHEGRVASPSASLADV